MSEVLLALAVLAGILTAPYLIEWLLALLRSYACR